MSLNVILDTIRASGEAQVREIEMHAYTQTREILANASLEAERIKEETCAAEIAVAVKERARVLHHARIEALQITGNEREGLVDSALDQIRGHLAGMRTDAAYSAVLHRLIREAINELASSMDEPGKARLEADLHDRKQLDDILNETGLNLEVSYNLNCWGGIIAKSLDDRVVVINTLEARLERATPYLRRYLAALFEDAHPEIKANSVADSIVIL
jgi:vacuolar-type H+-ATPase subunit E/Vma4